MRGWSAFRFSAGQAPVFDLKADDVSRIEVDDSGKSVAAERTEGGWRLVQPAGAADAARVEGAVGQIAKLNATRKLEDASDLASYGLSSPTSRLLLNMKDGSSQELLIGSKTPDQSSYYVKRADSPAIFVTATFALGDLMRWPSDPPDRKEWQAAIRDTKETWRASYERVERDRFFGVLAGSGDVVLREGVGTTAAA